MGHSPLASVQHDEPAPYWRNRDVSLLIVAFAGMRVSADLVQLETSWIRFGGGRPAGAAVSTLATEGGHILLANLVGLGVGLGVWFYGDRVDHRRFAALVFTGSAVLNAIVGFPISTTEDAAPLLGLLWYSRFLLSASFPLLLVLLLESVQPRQLLAALGFTMVASDVVAAGVLPLAALGARATSPAVLSFVSAAMVAIGGATIAGLRRRQPPLEEPYSGVFGVLPVLAAQPRVLMGALVLGVAGGLLRFPPGLVDGFRRILSFDQFANAQLGRQLAPVAVALTLVALGHTRRPARVTLLLAGIAAGALALLGAFGPPRSTLHYAVLLGGLSGLPELASSAARGVVLLASPPPARLRVLGWSDSAAGFAAVVPAVALIVTPFSDAEFGLYVATAGAVGLALVLFVLLAFPGLRRFTVADASEAPPGPPQPPPFEEPPPPPSPPPGPGLGVRGRGAIGP